MEFQDFPKMARLSRTVTVTEKLDGTNAQIHIVDLAATVSTAESRAYLDTYALYVKGDLVMLAGSRSKYLSVGKDGVKGGDNFGFAKWTCDNAADLMGLGVGRHYGEWWGSGIQRGYGLTDGEKRFSLFNTSRWADDRDREKYPQGRPSCCGVVPVMYRGPFDMGKVDAALFYLSTVGSVAAPGFMKPEGVVVFHEAAGVSFKKTIEKDDEHKGGR